MGTSRSTDASRIWIWKAGACLYSGRVNPTWTLPEAEATGLVDIWESLGLLVGYPSKQSRLGYFGCWMEDAAGRHWHAFDGRVQLSGPDGTSLRSDPGRAFECKLVASAPVGLLPISIDGNRLQP